MTVQIYGETRVLARGLTHPVAAGQAGKPQPRKRDRVSVAGQLARATGVSNFNNLGGRKNEFISADNNEDSGVSTTELGNGVSGSFLKRWGAVVVGAKALVSLLKAGETVLLFPGGGTEVRSCSCSCSCCCCCCCYWCCCCCCCCCCCFCCCCNMALHPKRK